MKTERNAYKIIYGSHTRIRLTVPGKNRWEVFNLYKKN